MPKKTSEDLDKAIIQSFARSFEYIFPGKETLVLNSPQAAPIWNRHCHLDTGRPKGVWDTQTKSVVAFLYASVEKGEPKAACSIPLASSPHERDLNFARAFSKIFNEDYLRCPDKLKTQELWRALRSTQFLRAIARVSGFDSVDASSWIQTMEGSMTLRYEGKPMQHAVIFYRNPKPVIQTFKKNVVQLHGKISLQQALLGEKWIRSVVDGKRVALIGSKSDNGGIIGLLSVSAIPEVVKDGRIVPHEPLRKIQSALGNADFALVASPTAGSNAC